MIGTKAYRSAHSLPLLASSRRGRERPPISLQEQGAASKALQELFEATGKEGLPMLADDRDVMVALHASWEHGKGDKRKTEQFIPRFTDRLKITPPRWWQDRLKGVVVYKGISHTFYGVDMRQLQKKSRLLHDRFQIDAFIDDGSIPILREAGFRFPIQVSDRKTKHILWKGEVWAAGRTVLAGVGAHQIEFVVSQGRLFVFGVESHGAYAEGFNLKDGTPLVRFCSCYWCNYSERWDWK
jgi:hypothetical protein